MKIRFRMPISSIADPQPVELLMGIVNDTRRWHPPSLSPRVTLSCKLGRDTHVTKVLYTPACSVAKKSPEKFNDVCFPPCFPCICGWDAFLKCRWGLAAFSRKAAAMAMYRNIEEAWQQQREENTSKKRVEAAKRKIELEVLVRI